MEPPSIEGFDQDPLCFFFHHERSRYKTLEAGDAHYPTRTSHHHKQRLWSTQSLALTFYPAPLPQIVMEQAIPINGFRNATTLSILLAALRLDQEHDTQHKTLSSITLPESP